MSRSPVAWAARKSNKRNVIKMEWRGNQFPDWWGLIPAALDILTINPSWMVFARNWRSSLCKLVLCLCWVPSPRHDWLHPTPDLGHHNLDKQLIKVINWRITNNHRQGKLFKKNKIFYFIMKVIITRCENILSDHNNDPICTFNNKSVTVNLKLQSFP